MLLPDYLLTNQVAAITVGIATIVFVTLLWKDIREIIKPPKN